MLFKNTSKDELDLAIMGLGKVRPEGEIEIPEYLWRPGVADGGGRSPSGVERMAPQLQPATPEGVAQWAEVPAVPAQRSRLRSIDRSTVDVSKLPPGVQAALSEAEAEEMAPAPAPVKRGRKPAQPTLDASAPAPAVEG